MNKRTTYLLIVFFLSLRLIAQTNDTNLLVKEEASQKAMSFLNLIPEGNESSYGFMNRSDFSKIVIEEPYQTIYITNMNNELSFAPGNEWRVPISVNGVYAALLTVQINLGKPEVVDLGGSMLAKKIQEFEKLYAYEGIQHVIIRNTFLNRDYIPVDFSKLYYQLDDADILGIKESALAPLYQLGEGQPVKILISTFCNETKEFIHVTEGDK